MNAHRCEEIFGQAERHARSLGAPEVEALISFQSSALTRFANNTIHQNVAEQSGHISLRVVLDGRTARASTNRLDEESIRRAVEEAVAITRLQEPDPELLPLAERAPVTEVDRRFADTAAVSPYDRACAVAEAIEVVRAAGQIAAGIYATSDTVSAVLNSRGVRTWHAETMAQFSITAMAADSSGWAKASACHHRDLDPAGLARAAARKAAASRSPAELAPGRYPV
ncbi:MAG TPA: DNA gyrase modulator, partial [Bryobacteraceae bacterium]|nr:DNA gyrase modulator [Bryobacteraceae bacterium]